MTEPFLRKDIKEGTIMPVLVCVASSIIAAKNDRAGYRRFTVANPASFGMPSSAPYLILYPVERSGTTYISRFMDPMTMEMGTKAFYNANDLQAFMSAATPYEGELVGKDLQEKMEEQGKADKKKQRAERRIMPPTQRVVSRTVAESPTDNPNDANAIRALTPIAGETVTVKGLQDGTYEVTTRSGPLVISEDLFRLVMLAPELGRESANKIQRDFEKSYGTTEKMKEILPTQYPNLARYVQKGLVKVLDSSKIFANYREGVGGQEGNPMGESYFKNDVKLYGGNPDEFLREFSVDWATPNKRFNAESGKEDSLRGYYSPQVLFVPERATQTPEEAAIAKETGGVPPEVLEEAESIATRSAGYKPYRDGGVFFNSTDLFRVVLGLSGGSARDLMQPSVLPGGSLERRKRKKASTWIMENCRFAMVENA